MLNGTEPRTSRTVWVARGALAAYLCWLAWLLLWPTPDVPIRSVTAVDNAVTSAGIGGSGDLTRGIIEFGLNVVAFAVLPVLSSLGGVRLSVRTWTIVGLLVSGTVELFQALALDGRSGTVRDLAANTLGAALGAALVSLDEHRRGGSAHDDRSRP